MNRYSTNQTGPKTQFRGLRAGLRNCVYHVLTDIDVEATPTAAELKQARVKKKSISQPRSDMDTFESGNLCDEFLRVEFSCGAGKRHVADFSEYWPVRPGTIMLAQDGPSDSRITVGVTSIQFITVVELQRALKRNRD